jgi:hypothetical protein
MTISSPIAPKAGSSTAARTLGAGYLFGLPLGDLGWFATLLVSVASGFASFFAATFLGIVGLLIANGVTHQTPDYSIAYRLIGLPVGLLVLATASSYLGFLWVRRITRRS